MVSWVISMFNSITNIGNTVFSSYILLWKQTWNYKVSMGKGAWICHKTGGIVYTEKPSLLLHTQTDITVRGQKSIDTRLHIWQALIIRICWNHRKLYPKHVQTISHFECQCKHLDSYSQPPISTLMFFKFMESRSTYKT